MLAARSVHLLYGESEMSGKNGGSPHVLPPLQNKFLGDYNPTKGQLTCEADAEKIGRRCSLSPPIVTSSDPDQRVTELTRTFLVNALTRTFLVQGPKKLKKKSAGPPLPQNLS